MFIEYRLHAMQRLYTNIHRQVMSLYSDGSLSCFACLSQVFCALFARPDPTSFYKPVHTYLNDNRVAGSNLLLLQHDTIHYNHITQNWTWRVPLEDRNQLLRAFTGAAQRRIKNMQAQARQDRFQPSPVRVYTLPAPPPAAAAEEEEERRFGAIEEYINQPPPPHTFRIVHLPDYFRTCEYPIRHMIHFYLAHGFNLFTANSFVNWWSQDVKNIASYHDVREYLVDANNYELFANFELIHLQERDALYTVFNASIILFSAWYMYTNIFIIERTNSFSTICTTYV